MSIRAEKRLRAPDAGLESLSVKKVSEQDKRFLKKKDSPVAQEDTGKTVWRFSAHISGEPVLQLLSLRVTLPRLSLFATRSSLGVLCSRRVTEGGLCSSWDRCSMLL